MLKIKPIYFALTIQIASFISYFTEIRSLIYSKNPFTINLPLKPHVLTDIFS